MDITVHIVNAFTDNEKGGNPAGVVLDADSLGTDDKQMVAARVGMSETAFVSSSTVAGFKLDFFTPTRQIAHCGHATIATFSLLHQLGRITRSETSKETIDGIRKIIVKENKIFMEQTAPRYSGIDHETDSLCASLGISAQDLPSDFKPLIVHTGNAFLVVPLADENTVSRVIPDFDVIRNMSEKFDLIGYYVFSRETRRPGRDAGARMFAPRYGIQEESATGMAAGPLACYLYDHMGMRRESFLVEQGHFMQPPSPSVIHVPLTVEAGRIAGLLAGGSAQRTVSKIIALQGNRSSDDAGQNARGRVNKEQLSMEQPQ
jgi:PhzF family phenazine biosynthesis protein